MTAHLGLQDPARKLLLRQSGQLHLQVTDQLEPAAPLQAVAEQWVKRSNNPRYMLVRACNGPASIARRQSMPRLRYSIRLCTARQTEVQAELYNMRVLTYYQMLWKLTTQRDKRSATAALTTACRIVQVVRTDAKQQQ